MDIVEIPTTGLLKEMMKKLGLPEPTYKAEMSGKAKLVSSVTFYPATRCLTEVYGTVSLLSSPMDTLEEANNNAAKQVIKYMQKNEKKILKDYNYDQLEAEKMIKEDHMNQSFENNRKLSRIIKERDQQIENMTKQWDDFIEDVSTANNKIHNIVQEGYTIGESDEEKRVNCMLAEVQTGTEHVKLLAFVATDVLQQIGKFPCDMDSGSGETAPFSAYFPSPPLSPPRRYIESCLHDEYMSDSDDLTSMDYLHL